MELLNQLPCALQVHSLTTHLLGEYTLVLILSPAWGILVGTQVEGVGGGGAFMAQFTALILCFAVKSLTRAKKLLCEILNKSCLWYDNAEHGPYPIHCTAGQ